jgi:phosphatidylglycerol:prolipoprotein diacylglycerol transferase
VLTYPDFDPTAVDVGPIPLPWIGPLTLHIRWYGVMYLLGIGAGWLLLRRRARKPESGWTVLQVDDLVFYAVLGVILGGRVGYVLIYALDTLLKDPLYLFRIWEGGMSFHGGLTGVLIAMLVYARRGGVRRPFFAVTDFIAPGVPPGLFAGRIGNFINGELWGKTTDVPWAFLYQGQPRHPSQLYEAGLEGIALFLILWLYSAKPRPVCAVSGMFLLCYGCFRFLVEFVRVPDKQFGYLAFGWVTMGQVLSAPMIAIGILLLVLAYTRRTPAVQPAPR